VGRLDRRTVLIAALAAIPLAQFGHLLAYLLRFGPHAIVPQGSGVHHYFPTLLTSGAAALGAALLAGLLLIALARFMVGVRNDRVPGGGRPVLPLLLVLLAIQLGVYWGQELAECAAAGLNSPAPGLVLGWGLAGQLPVAALAAFGLSWLTARVEQAVAKLRTARPVVALPREAQVLLPVWAPVAARLQLQAAESGFRKRGPPAPPFS
jgi:hypothetical protein